MEKKLRILSNIICALISLSVYAQEEAKLPEIIPPYPQSADLGKYGNVPIGLHTGTPNLNFEIYSLRQNNLSVPISINYSSSGVKIDEIQTQLGIDWHLIAGGVISREIRDRDDLSNDFFTPADEGVLCIPSNQAAINLANGNIDSEKDIFSYSAMGISGKFILTGEDFTEIMPNGNKIELLHVPYSGGVERVFKITDVAGTEYYFGENNSRETSLNINYCGSAPTPNDYYETAWYLSKVKTATGLEVLFTYTHEVYSYIPLYTQNSVAVTNNSPYGTSIAGIGIPCNSVEHHNTVFLNDITFKNKKITFEYQQLEVSPAISKQLTRINVYWDTTSGNLRLLKHYDFDYYSVSPNNAAYLQNSNTDSTKKRIFLKQVMEVAPDGVSIRKYFFDYYNPELLPPRFSFSRDLYDYYNDAHNTNMVYNNLGPEDMLYQAFLGVHSNRDANPLVNYYGMLHNIYYPTGGKTEFIYEPNSIYVTETVIPPLHTVLAGDGGHDVMHYTAYSEPFTVTYTQTAHLFGQAQTITEDCGIHPYKAPEALVSVESITDPTELTGGLTATSTGVLGTAHLIAGHTYRLKVYSMWFCEETQASITFIDPPYDIHINKPVAGVRVQKTMDNDDNGNATIKKYSYGELDCIDCSSGHFMTNDPDAVRNIDKFATNLGGGKFKYTMSSNSKSPLYSFNGTAIGYSSVIESSGENFERGGNQHKFNMEFDSYPAALCQTYMRGTPYSNGIFHGEEIETSAFKKTGNAFTKLSTDELIYAEDPNFDNEIVNYTGSLRALDPLVYQMGTDYFYSFNKYLIKTGRYFLSSKTSRVYDPEGNHPIETVTKYYYDNPQHLQLTRTETINSENEVIVNKTYYPDDLISEPVMASLKAQNRIGEPILTEVYNNGNKISAQKSTYINDSNSSNLPLKGNVFNARFPNTFINIPNIGQMEKTVSFDKYDSEGNTLQYTPEDANSVIIVWGYQKAYPIAKIENASYISMTSGQLSLISGVVAASDSDIDLSSENYLKSKLTALRNGFPRSMVTTLTYNPLIGITSVTDPNSLITTYNYDSLGRLLTVRDNQGSIITENAYHLKTSN